LGAEGRVNLGGIERPQCIRREMPLDAKKLRDPLRKLKKSLKKLTDRPSPDEVHKLRTQARRLEAIVHGLMQDRRKPARTLLETVAPIRKRAGKVRDMDVLTDFAAGLSRDEEECRVQLLENLGERRTRFARKLHDTVKTHAKSARRLLRRYDARIDKAFRRADSGTVAKTDWPAVATAVALQISSELAHWPTLKASNIHPFRLKVKELRYVLQLAENADSDFVDALGEVKDKIGEWHDWTELESIATEVLEHSRGCKVLSEIHVTAEEKFRVAISAATSLRRKYLSAEKKHGSRTLRRPSISEPVVITTASLAA